MNSETRGYATEGLTSWSKRWQFNTHFLRGPFLLGTGERIETRSWNVTWARLPQQSPYLSLLRAIIPGICHQAWLKLSISYTEADSRRQGLPCLPCPEVMVVVGLSRPWSYISFFSLKNLAQVGRRNLLALQQNQSFCQSDAFLMMWPPRLLWHIHTEKELLTTCNFAVWTSQPWDRYTKITSQHLFYNCSTPVRQK